MEMKRKKRLSKDSFIIRRSKRSWFINATLFYALKLYPFRKKDCWVFGCWEGNKYDDNSRYLFEYVNKYHPEIKAIWLTASEAIVNQVKAKGNTAYLYFSQEGIRAQLRAGVAFYTNGLDDFGNVCFVYGAKIVALWHGVGIKNIYYAGQKRNYRFWKNYIIDKIFSWTYRTYTVSSSEESSRFFTDSLLVSKKNIIMTGFPRNDVFRYNLRPSEVLTYSNADDYYYILYMPTYREYEDDTIQNTIEAVVSDSTFLSFLKENKIRFLIKKHYLTVFGNTELPHEVHIVENGEFSSTQELLAVADVLVTDYSSCITDYVLTGKPAILYAIDFDTYRKKVGLNQGWQEIYDVFGIKNIGVLKKSLIRTFINKDGIAYDTTKYLKPIYEGDDIEGTCYCENLCQYLMRNE